MVQKYFNDFLYVMKTGALIRYVDAQVNPIAMTFFLGFYPRVTPLFERLPEGRGGYRSSPTFSSKFTPKVTPNV